MFNLKSYKAVTGRTDDCTRRMGMLLQKQREYSYIRTEKLQMHAYIESIELIFAQMRGNLTVS